MTRQTSQKTLATDFSDLGVLPLINVVFLLLMFFMIAGTISSQDRSLQLPDSSSEESQAKNSIQLEIIDSGVVLLNGENVNHDLKALLKQALLTDVNTKQKELIVRISKELDVSALDQVLIAIRELDIKKVQIATEAQR